MDQKAQKIQAAQELTLPEEAAKIQVNTFVKEFFQVSKYLILVSIPRSQKDVQNRPFKENQANQLILELIQDQRIGADQQKQKNKIQDDRDFYDYLLFDEVPIGLQIETLKDINTFLHSSKYFAALANHFIQQKICETLHEVNTGE